MNSLLGAKFARDLKASLLEGMVPARISGSKTGRYRNVNFMARHCYRGLNYTGGLFIECRVDDYISVLHTKKIARLNPRWTEKQFVSAVQRLTGSGDWRITTAGVFG